MIQKIMRILDTMFPSTLEMKYKEMVGSVSSKKNKFEDTLREEFKNAREFN